MTARLELDYRGPVPLEQPLVLRGGVAEDAGRKAVITGTIALAAAPERGPGRGPRGVRAPRARRRARPTSAPITDASGRHAPARRPTDATALDDAV